MANLSAECRFKNISINMQSLYVWLHDKYKANSVYICTGYLEKYKEEYEQNKYIGYTYIFKEAVYNKDEQKIKANCDVDIAIHGTVHTLEDNLHTAILISSDGDFASLIKFWQERGVIAKVISPAEPDRCSYLLKKNAPVTYLGQVLHRFINEKALNEDETS